MSTLPAANIHERLCDLRNEMGKTQKEVADALGIPASVLSRIERGETKSVGHDLIVKFAKYYKVSADYLLCISDLKIRKNADLEDLGLSNYALIMLLQRKLDGDMLSRMMEHPYFSVLLDTAAQYFEGAGHAAYATRNAILDIGIMDIKAYVQEHPEYTTEAMHDIRRINAEKISGPEADIEKLKNIFVKILKDLKKDFDVPQKDASMEEVIKTFADMKEQAQLQKQMNQTFNESDVANIVLRTMSNVGMDDEAKELFRKLLIHMLKTKI